MKDEQMCCPKCSYEGSMSEFKPRVFAENKKSKKPGLEIYVTSSKDEIEEV
jgi:hypothetical protein